MITCDLLWLSIIIYDFIRFHMISYDFISFYIWFPMMSYHRGSTEIPWGIPPRDSITGYPRGALWEHMRVSTRTPVVTISMVVGGSRVNFKNMTCLWYAIDSDHTKNKSFGFLWSYMISYGFISFHNDFTWFIWFNTISCDFIWFQWFPLLSIISYVSFFLMISKDFIRFHIISNDF